MAAISNGRILVFYTDFQVAPPLESYILSSTMTMHVTLHELHRGSTTQQ